MAKRFPGDGARRDYLYDEYFDEEDTDVMMAALAYILIRHTDMDRELVYSLFLGEGGAITWH